MAEIRDVTDVETALQALATREDGPFVVKLPREPGRRDSRYAHLIGGPVEMQAEPESPGAQAHAHAPSLADRIASLEAQVAGLRDELQRLRQGDSG